MKTRNERETGGWEEGGRERGRIFIQRTGDRRQRQKCWHIEVRPLQKQTNKEEAEVALKGGGKDTGAHFSQGQKINFNSVLLFILVIDMHN